MSLLEQEYLEGVKGPAHLVPRLAVGAKNDDDDDRGLGWWNASATPMRRDDSAAAARQ